MKLTEVHWLSEEKSDESTWPARLSVDNMTSLTNGAIVSMLFQLFDFEPLPVFLSWYYHSISSRCYHIKGV